MNESEPPIACPERSRRKVPWKRTVCQNCD